MEDPEIPKVASEHLGPQPRGPLPVKEIAIYYDRWEGEGSLCSLQDTDRDIPSFPIDSRKSAIAIVPG